MRGEPRDIWVFGYGSLMWRPDFPYAERAKARVDGYHRGFCIRSTYHRGTRQRPGLVLGLDRGRMCVGMAYRIAAEHAPSTVAYLRARELIYGVYRETAVTAVLDEPERRTIMALAYTAEPLHPNYAGTLSLQEQAFQIRGACGFSGDNLDYLFNTVRHLQRLDIREREIERLAGLAGVVAGRGDRDSLIRPSAAGMRKVWSRRASISPPVQIADQRRFGYRMMLVRHW